MKNKTVEDPSLKYDFYSKNAYAKLTSNISFASIDQDVKVIMITSTSAEEFKSTITSNLALKYAELEKKVLIIDLDLRHPSIHKAFNVPNTEGIVDYITKDIELSSIINKSADLVDVITAGKKTDFVDKVVSSNKLKQLIDTLKEQYDYILLDTAPVSETADALQISNLADGTLFVIKLNTTNKKNAKKSIEALQFANANILGIVVSNEKIKKNHYSYYYNQKA